MEADRNRVPDEHNVASPINRVERLPGGGYWLLLLAVAALRIARSKTESQDR